MTDGTACALIDVGAGGRLERFGDRLVDRPAVGAMEERGDPGAWRGAGLRFDRERGWSGPAAGAGPWTLALDGSGAGLTVELRPTEAGQVGLFPEHLAMLPWLAGRGSATVLDLFAYTGLTTLALAQHGAAVTHVDASRPAVTWARRNAELSGLADRPIRWIVDDAMGFVGRELRRGRRYGGLVLDPPSYGHGPGGRPWTMDALPELLAGCRGVLDPDAFVLLTAHTPGYDAERLAGLLRDGIGRSARAIESGELELRTADGRALALGAFARTPRAA